MPRVARTLLVVSLVLVACDNGGSGAEGSRAPASTSASATSVAPTTGTPSPTGVILVQDFAADDRPVRVMTPDGEEVATLEPPTALDGPLDLVTVLAAPGAPHFVGAAVDALVKVDLTDFTVTTIAADAEIRWSSPDQRLALVGVGGGLAALDVGAGTLLPIADSPDVVGVSWAGDVIGLTVATPGAPSFVVDVANGTVTDVGELAGPTIDDGGERFFIRRRIGEIRSRRRQVLVAPLSDPDSPEIWVEDEGDADVAWGDDTLLFASVDGVVRSVDASGTEAELGRIPLDEDGSSLPRLHPTPTGAGALVSVEEAESTNWYHIDPDNGDVVPLPDLAGLGISVTLLAPDGYLVLDDRNADGLEITRAVAVEIAVGTATEVIALEQPATVTGGPLRRGHLMFRSGSDAALQIVDLTDGSSVELPQVQRAVASPDGRWVAVDLALRGAAPSDRHVGIVSLGGGAPVEIAAGRIVAWVDPPE